MQGSASLSQLVMHNSKGRLHCVAVKSDAAHLFRQSPGRIAAAASGHTAVVRHVGV